MNWVSTLINEDNKSMSIEKTPLMKIPIISLIGLLMLLYSLQKNPLVVICFIVLTSFLLVSKRFGLVVAIVTYFINSSLGAAFVLAHLIRILRKEEKKSLKRISLFTIIPIISALHCYIEINKPVWAYRGVPKLWFEDSLFEIFFQKSVIRVSQGAVLDTVYLPDFVYLFKVFRATVPLILGSGQWKKKTSLLCAALCFSSFALHEISLVYILHGYLCRSFVHRAALFSACSLAVSAAAQYILLEASQQENTNFL